MRRIDELHLEYPFAGSRMLQGFLVREGFVIGRLKWLGLFEQFSCGL
jgi:putative transposase